MISDEQVTEELKAFDDEGARRAHEIWHLAQVQQWWDGMGDWLRIHFALRAAGCDDKDILAIVEKPWKWIEEAWDVHVSDVGAENAYEVQR